MTNQHARQRQLVDRRQPMSKLARALILGATLAAMNLAGLTAIAQANDQPAGADAVEQFRRGERASQEQPTTGKAVEEFRRGERASQEQTTTGKAVEAFRRGERASQEQTAADAAVQRQLARERHSIPSATPSQVPAPVPDEPSGTPGWLLASLGVLVAALAFAGGMAVLAAKRAGRRTRIRHAA